VAIQQALTAHGGEAWQTTASVTDDQPLALQRRLDFMEVLIKDVHWCLNGQYSFQSEFGEKSSGDVPVSCMRGEAALFHPGSSVDSPSQNSESVTGGTRDSGGTGQVGGISPRPGATTEQSVEAPLIQEVQKNVGIPQRLEVIAVETVDKIVDVPVVDQAEVPQVQTIKTFVEVPGARAANSASQETLQAPSPSSASCNAVSCDAALSTWPSCITSIGLSAS